MKSLIKIKHIYLAKLATCAKMTNFCVVSTRIHFLEFFILPLMIEERMFSGIRMRKSE